MDNLSSYESRIGKIESGAQKVFDFITDMRNFNRFIPSDAIKDWEATEDECSFQVPPVGKSQIRVERKDPWDTVKYAGKGMNNTEFYLWVQLKEIKEDDTRVKITIKADLNPALKMMASKPIKDFLNKLVNGMENFDDWDAANS